MSERPGILQRLRLAARVYRDGMPARYNKASPMRWPDFRIGQAQWHMVNLEAYIEEGFNMNTLIYSAIMYKARSISGVPFRAYTGDPDEPELLPEDNPAFRMQTSLPEFADISREPAQIQAMYGIGSQDEHQNYYAIQTLRARRRVEAGVRFIEITCPSFDGNNSPWDQHGALKANHEKNARITEQSVAALIRDLKQRGLLDETLVVWAGEMGRTPHSPGKDGRDHHINGYSIFFAGGGIRGGMTYGTTNDFG